MNEINLIVSTSLSSVHYVEELSLVQCKVDIINFRFVTKILFFVMLIAFLKLVYMIVK